MQPWYAYATGCEQNCSVVVRIDIVKFATIEINKQAKDPVIPFLNLRVLSLGLHNNITALDLLFIRLHLKLLLLQRLYHLIIVQHVFTAEVCHPHFLVTLLQVTRSALPLVP